MKLVPQRFLPPPLPITHTANGIEWAKDDKDATYLSSYQNMALRSTLTTDRIKKKHPKGVAYDFSCPVLSQDVIKQRICQHCGLYLSSLKAKSLRITSCRIDKNNHDEIEKPRVRPTRVAARRQRELLCVMEFQEMELAAMDEVDFDDLDNGANFETDLGTPIIDTDDISPTWIDED